VFRSNRTGFYIPSERTNEKKATRKVALFVGVPTGIVTVSPYGDPAIPRPLARDRRL